MINRTRRTALAEAMRARPSATYRELGKAVGLSSSSSVYEMVQGMMRAGQVVVAECPCCHGRTWKLVATAHTFG